MNPKLASLLMKKQARPMREFIVFVQCEANKLDRSSDIEETDPVKVAVEVKARKLAFETLKNILHPLLNSSEEVETISGNKEYAM